MRESSRQMLTAVVALGLAAVLWPARCPGRCHVNHPAAPRLGIRSYPAPRVENQGAEQAPGDAAERPEQPAEQPAEQPEPEVPIADQLLADMPDTLEAFEEWVEESTYERFVEPILERHFEDPDLDWYERREAIMAALTEEHRRRDRYLNDAAYMYEEAARLAETDSSMNSRVLFEGVEDSIDRLEDMYIEADSKMFSEGLRRVHADRYAEDVGIPGITERIVKARTEGEDDARNVRPDWMRDNEREPDLPTHPAFDPSRPSAGGRSPDLDTQIKTLEREIRETVERIDDANKLALDAYRSAPIHKIPRGDDGLQPEGYETMNRIYERVHERAGEVSGQDELEQTYLDKSVQLEALRQQQKEDTPTSSYMDWFSWD
jgi:hypothetical protein